MGHFKTEWAEAHDLAEKISEQSGEMKENIEQYLTTWKQVDAQLKKRYEEQMERNRKEWNYTKAIWSVGFMWNRVGVKNPFNRFSKLA